MVAVPARVARCANAPAGDDAIHGDGCPAPRRTRLAVRNAATVGASPGTAGSTRRIAATMRRAAWGWPDFRPLRRRATRRRPVLDAPRRESRPGGGWRRASRADRVRCRGKSGLRCPCNEGPVQAGRKATRRIRAAKRCQPVWNPVACDRVFFLARSNFAGAKFEREKRASPAREKTWFFPRARGRGEDVWSVQNVSFARSGSLRRSCARGAGPRRGRSWRCTRRRAATARRRLRCRC